MCKFDINKNNLNERLNVIVKYIKKQCNFSSTSLQPLLMFKIALQPKIELKNEIYV